MDRSLASRQPVWMTDASCSLEDFRGVVERRTDAASYPLAEEIQKNIPIYDAAKIRQALDKDEPVQDYMAEWNGIFLDGPGVAVFRRSYDDMALIDDVTNILTAMIAHERQLTGGRGDHFARAGENARLWNSHEKLCIAAPELFARYNANDILALVSRSWLGPLYQITAQVNVVYPGGKAQTTFVSTLRRPKGYQLHQ